MAGGTDNNKQKAAVEEMTVAVIAMATETETAMVTAKPKAYFDVNE
jgi:hypothetical protein